MLFYLPVLCDALPFHPHVCVPNFALDLNFDRMFVWFDHPVLGDHPHHHHDGLSHGHAEHAVFASKSETSFTGSVCIARGGCIPRIWGGR